MVSHDCDLLSVAWHHAAVADSKLPKPEYEIRTALLPPHGVAAVSAEYPMGGMIVLMVPTDSGYSYPGYVTYLSALYTFYTIILAIVNLVTFRKLGSPILSAAKVLNFVAALMSLLGLQTAMIPQFSTEGENFRRLMNAITGGGVWFSVILTAVYMLLHSRNMKEVKSVEPLGE